jgi:predicted transcriptional regulator
MIREIEERLRKADAASIEWSDPQPLPKGLPPVEPFVPGLLPPALRPWIMDIAERMQCPPDFPAASAIVALGSVIGRRCGIRPKRQDDWMVVPNLWGAVIGRPGVLKSPAIEEALRPLHRLEVQACEAHAAEIKLWQADQEAGSLALTAEKEKAKAELKKGTKTREEVAATLVALWDGNGEPTRTRYIVNDSTVEKLGELLAGNPTGLLLVRDELVAWLRSFDRDGREGDRAFYLEAWNGNGRFTYDRIGRGTVEIPAACVSVFGAIQPGPLLAYLSRSAFDGAGDDGLLQRLQVVVWPDLSAEWQNVDRWPDMEAKRVAFETFSRLASLSASTIGATCDSNAVPFLRFDDEAQDAFDVWRAELERVLRAGNGHPAWEAYLAKHRKLIPAVALICHLADGGTGSVSLAAFKRAELWGEYLKSHAARLYDGLLRRDVSAAKALADRILAGDLGNEFALRDVYRRCWSGISSREAARAAAVVLCDHDWLREAPRAGTGRTATVYLINSKLLEKGA